MIVGELVYVHGDFGVRYDERTTSPAPQARKVLFDALDRQSSEEEAETESSAEKACDAPRFFSYGEDAFGKREERVRCARIDIEEIASREGTVRKVHVRSSRIRIAVFYLLTSHDGIRKFGMFSPRALPEVFDSTCTQERYVCAREEKRCVRPRQADGTRKRSFDGGRTFGEGDFLR